MGEVFLVFSIIVCIGGWTASCLRDRTGTTNVSDWIDYGKKSVESSEIYQEWQKQMAEYKHPHLRRREKQPADDPGYDSDFSDDFDLEAQGFSVVDESTVKTF
jgi:hypothetical protein